MNKKRFLSVLIAAVMIFGAAVPALAASVDSSAETADVAFIPKTSGALEFNSTLAPASLTFGTRTIELKPQYYPESSGNPIEFQVDDARGTGTGWKVTAELANFVGTTYSGNLAGATITFQAGTITQQSHNGSEIPTSTGVTLTAGSGTAGLIMKADPSSSTAKAGTGFSKISYAVPGTTNASDTAVGEPIELMVGGGTALQDTYTATLTWTLYDAP